MTAWWMGVALGTPCVVLVAWLVPTWVVGRLLPTLERSGHVATNYRGREVVPGLGVVWLAWATGFALLGAVLGVESPASGEVLVESVMRPLPALPILLVAGAFAFGLIDDVFGDAGSKGFRGHLRALKEGRLTTGALKLLGIGALAVASSVDAFSRVGLSSGQPGPRTFALGIVAWALAALVIALAANFVNLTDLRPGRALKAYSLLAVFGVLASAWRLSHIYPTTAGLGSPMPGATLWAFSGALLLAVALLGPVAAVWRHDLGERAMLGDAGANAMGALAGYVLAANLPLWLLAVAAAVLIALNLASERVSFSRVVEEQPLLRWIDGLGRLKADHLDGRPADVAAGNLVERGAGPMGTDAGMTDPEQGRDGGS